MKKILGLLVLAVMLTGCLISATEAGLRHEEKMTILKIGMEREGALRTMPEEATLLTTYSNGWIKFELEGVEYLYRQFYHNSCITAIPK